MNLYREDDTGTLMGDLYLNDNSEEQILKLFAEGNLYNISAIGRYLVFGVEEATDDGEVWIERLSKVTSYNAVVKKYAKKMFGTESVLGEKKAQVEKAIESDLDETATILLRNWGDIRKVFTDEEENEKAIVDFLENNDDEAGDDTVKEKKEWIDLAENFAEATTVEYSKKVKYGKKTVYDLFTVPASTFEKNIKNLYPLAYALSEGQRALADTMNISDLFQAAFMRKDLIDNKKGDNGDSEKLIDDSLKQADPISVYEGVDRDQFSDNAAMTSRATANMSSKEDEETNTVFYNIMYGSWILAGSTLLLTGYYLSGVLWTKYELNQAFDAFDEIVETVDGEEVIRQGFGEGDKAVAEYDIAYYEKELSEIKGGV